MRVLYLIGNGFDLNAGLKTSYPSILEEYLKPGKDANAALKLKETLRQAQSESDLATATNAHNSKKPNWRDLELWFGEHSSAYTKERAFTDCLYDFSEEFMDYLQREEDKSPVKKRLRNYRVSSKLMYDVIHFESLIDDRSEKVRKLLDGSYREYDFVTFNYTNTLDDVVNELKFIEEPLISHPFSAKIDIAKLKKRWLVVLAVLLIEAIIIFLHADTIIDPTAGYDNALLYLAKLFDASASDANVLNMKYFAYYATAITSSIWNVIMFVKHFLSIKLGHDEGLKINDAIHLHGTTDMASIIGVDNVKQIANRIFRKSNEVKRAFVKPYINFERKSSPTQRVKKLIRYSDIIVIYGLSFGETDRYWWRQILNWGRKNALQKKMVLINWFSSTYEPRRAQSSGDAKNFVIGALQKGSGRKHVNGKMMHVAAYGEKNSSDNIFESLSVHYTTESALADSRKYGQLYYDRGYRLHERGEIKKAIADMKRAISLCGEDMMAYHDLGVMNQDLGNTDLALYYYAEAIRVSPDNETGYFARGNLYFYIKEYQRAIDDYLKASRCAPTNMQILYNTSACYVQLDDLPNAHRFLSTVIETEPNNFDALKLRGALYVETKKASAAIVDLEKATTEDRADMSVLLNLGTAYSLIGNKKKAVSIFTRVIRTNKGNIPAHFNRGNAYTDLKKYRKAIKDFTEVLRLNMYDSNAYNNRGNCYSALLQHKKAIADYTKAIDEDQTYIKAYRNRGHEYACLGQWEESIESYSTAIALDPNDPGVRFSRSNAYRKLGDSQKADEELVYAENLNKSVKAESGSQML